MLLKRYPYVDLIVFALTATHDAKTKEPRTNSMAIKIDKLDGWKKAMEVEIRSLTKKSYKRYD